MIRKASLDDIPAIRQLAVKVFPLTYRNILSEKQIEYMMDMMYSEESLRIQMTAQGNIFYISDGKGYVSYRHDEGNVFHLEKLYVLPEYQGTGLGKELFDTVVEAVSRNIAGPIRVELNVNRYNKAVSFYEHMGMHRDREGDFPIGGGFFMNDYIMVLDC